MSTTDDGAAPWQSDFGMNAVLAAWHHRRTEQRMAMAAAFTALGFEIAPVDTPREPGTGVLAIEGQRPDVEGTHLELLIPASILNLGDTVTEGQLIEAVALPWFKILHELERDPQFLHHLHWRKIEEFVAGAYKREGWPDVILTPRSGDGGRDIIASKPGVGAVRIIDQVKERRQH